VRHPPPPAYYDFNVFSWEKWTEKLRYIHRNPVTRGLVAAPEDWKWSSYRHWLTGTRGRVEIESHWTFREREKMGVHPKFIKEPEQWSKRGPSHPTPSTRSGQALTPKDG